MDPHEIDARSLWSVSLTHGEVEVRSMRLRDAGAWRAVRLRNEAWLSPWEPTMQGNWESRHTYARFLRTRSAARVAARERSLIPLVVLHRGAFVGQVNIGPIQWGPVCSGDVGYWIDQRHAGHGITPIAVALAIGHAFGLGLHRVQAAIAPENASSIRVAEKLGMRPEGLIERYLFVAGRWRDHVSYALTADDDLSALRAVLSR